MDVPVPENRGHPLAVVDRGIDGSAGKEPDQGSEHVFRPAHLIQPVVNEGNLRFSTHGQEELWIGAGGGVPTRGAGLAGYLAPVPERTVGIVRARIFKSSQSDQ